MGFSSGESETGVREGVMDIGPGEGRGVVVVGEADGILEGEESIGEGEGAGSVEGERNDGEGDGVGGFWM